MSKMLKICDSLYSYIFFIYLYFFYFLARGIINIFNITTDYQLVKGK